MMDGTAQGLLIGEPAVDVAAMAAIVRDLVTGGVERIPSARWLRRRVRQAGLGPLDYAALETLRTRLLTQGSAFLDALGDLSVW